MMFGSRIVNNLVLFQSRFCRLLIHGTALVLLLQIGQLVAAPMPTTTERTERQLNQSLPFSPISEARYHSCLAALNPDPISAVEYATAWREEGGGYAATHCLALGFYQLGHVIQAASTLHNLAQEISGSQAEFNSKTYAKLRSQILGQAGVLYDLGGDSESALSELTTALNLNPDDVEILIDRAMMSGKQSNWRSALSDLDLVVKKLPKNLGSPSLNEALLLRATALRHLGDLASARQGIDQILSQSPQDQAALIESGNIYVASGNLNGARRAWLAVLAAQDQGKMADTARSLLQNLELNRGKQ